MGECKRSGPSLVVLKCPKAHVKLKGSFSLNDVDCLGHGQKVSTHHQHLIQPKLYSVPDNCRGCYYGYGMDTSLTHRLVRTLIPNNVERGGGCKWSQHRCSKKSNGYFTMTAKFSRAHWLILLSISGQTHKFIIYAIMTRYCSSQIEVSRIFVSPAFFSCFDSILITLPYIVIVKNKLMSVFHASVLLLICYRLVDPQLL